MRYRKTVASFMAFAVLAGTVSVSGCNRNSNGSHGVVSADSTWYNMDKKTLEIDYDPVQFDFLVTSPIGRVGEYVALESSAFYADFEVTQSFVDYHADFVDIYDMNGDHINSIDVVDLLSNSEIVDDYVELMYGADADEISYDNALSSFWSGGLCVVNDKIKVAVTFAGRSYSSQVEYAAYIDPVTADVTYELVEEDANAGMVNEGIRNFGEYRVESLYDYSGGYGYENASYVINIYDDSGLVRSVDLSEKMPDDNILLLDSIMRVDDSTLLVKYYPSSGSLGYLTIDIGTGDVHVDDSGEYAWLSGYNTEESTYFDGVGSVILDDEGIKTINCETMTLDEVFSFDSCNVNRGDIRGLRIVSYSEDEIVMVGSVYRGNLFNNTINDSQLIILNRADSNPNAGKTILTAATVGDIDYAMSEAVCLFNETNPDYFIQFDNRYKADKYIDNANVDFSDSEAYSRAYDDATVELSNQLAVDLMAGDGPDIIFDTASLSQLNNADYLLDISDRVNTDGLFSNIIDASKVDGKLYQLPLTFGVTGIAVLNENVSAGQVGFTYEQYGEFVSTVCNGKDPLAMDQTDFFITCMDTMWDQFITEEGNIDCDNEAFRALAEYTNENVFAPVVIREEDTYTVEFGTTDTMLTDGAVRIDASTFDMYVALLGNHADSSTILGIPSIDARGPVATVTGSVAISAKTTEVDACMSFVETLLSPEVQEYYALASKGCPVSVSAYESFAQDIIDDYNVAIEQVSRYMSPGAMAVSGPHMTAIDYSVIDNYETMILSCSSVLSTDTAIKVIVREEMPAYFSGQKTLDEVISIIENRVQTYLDERG
ncbi:MAG: extracellular solute-binding protein [Saccharofermentans sp.]|nr:extracellular solute-binding protein [Saccharofermentans sp.]